MFNQTGGLTIDPDQFYNATATFREYVSDAGLDWNTLSAMEKIQTYNAFNNTRKIDEVSGVDSEGARVARDNAGVTIGALKEEDLAADPVMVACNSASACNKFSHVDIVNELKRRGARNGGPFKYVMVHKSDLEYPSPGARTYDRVGGEDLSKAPAGLRYGKPADPNDPRNRYFTPNAEGDGEYYRVMADFNDKTTKPQLVKVLLGSNKQIARASAARARMKGTKGLKHGKGAFPSEATNPAMYDYRTGLLKEKHLTIDHHGLTAFDYNKNKYVVKWIPFNGPGNFSGSARWERYTEGTPNAAIIGKLMLRGIFDLDNKGLPKIGQLNYDEHLGMVHQDKNGKWMQVQCIRKNNKNKSISPSNCKRNKDGSIKIKWAPYDATLFTPGEVELQKEKKFITPLGVFTYDELMKMPLDKILKMMIVLELMDESPKYAEKLSALGVGPFAPERLSGALPGRTAGHTAAKKGTPKTTTTLSRIARVNEEKKFNEYGLPKCEFPNPPFRCYTDSYIPGTCVPDESMCFKQGLRAPWRSFMQDEKNFGGDTGKAREFYNWASEASQDASAVITEKDINDLLREQMADNKQNKQARAYLDAQRAASLRANTGN